METDIEKGCRNKGNRKKDNNGFIVIAIFLILFGGLLLFFNLGIIPIIYKPLIISWQMLLIAIGVSFLLSRHYVAGILFAGVGIVFIYPLLASSFPERFSEISVDIKTYWPVLLIFLGLILVLKRPCSSHKHNRLNNNQNNEDNYTHIRTNAREHSNTDSIDKSIMFGSSEQIVLSSNFKGGEGNVMFGELVIDLRKAKLEEGIVELKLNVMFGSVVLFVPHDWNIEVQTSNIFGSFDDRRYSSEYTSNESSRLIVKGSAMFGNGEIRN